MIILIKLTVLTVLCGVAYGSGIHEIQPAGAAPIVTAASSQYFERIFNRLVAAPVLEQVPVAPVLPAPPQVIPVSAPPPIIVEATRSTVLPAPPTSPPQNQPTDPNVAIAVATANAAAPVATILLPPYPFGFPPGFNFIPQPVANFPNDDPSKESTTQFGQKTFKTTTPREQEQATTPVPSNIDNSFVQALPTNENAYVFREYLAPQPPPQVPQGSFQQVPSPQQFPLPDKKPQKYKTTVEVVPVPLTYIAPPPEGLHNHHHHHPHHHHSLKLKAVPHVHTFIPQTKIILIRPKLEAYRVLRVPARSVLYKAKYRNSPKRISKSPQPYNREIEPTTFKPINRPFTKPPRL
ncbi:ras-associated and pleckstrin homology domains-containing protein 1-like [Pieris brassicae]|uniref:ras-associated and pleckstrin homology domains-containing protein 1-like n=1 Tax=Pieris brassicae TaxID=7116 RepID=UPI001E66098A|nr:ras-associated and pleckstrin homology domains-containing protein 1-like [Pieris brassicae]